MIYEGITILDKNLENRSQSQIFNMHPVMQREALRRIYNWALKHNTNRVSVVRLVHPGEASAFGVDDVITWGDKYFKYGIWKLKNTSKEIPSFMLIGE